MAIASFGQTASTLYLCRGCCFGWPLPLSGVNQLKQMYILFLKPVKHSTLHYTTYTLIFPPSSGDLCSRKSRDAHIRCSYWERRRRFVSRLLLCVSVCVLCFSILSLGILVSDCYCYRDPVRSVPVSLIPINGKPTHFVFRHFAVFLFYLSCSQQEISQ